MLTSCSTKRFLRSLAVLIVLNYIKVECSNLYVIPTPGVNNKVIASIDESFVLSCVSTGSNEDRPKALQWRSPTQQLITSDSSRRVYTQLTGDTLRLYFDKLSPSDSGTYSCVGIVSGTPQEVKADLVLQKKINFYETAVEQFVKGGLDQTVICRASANPGPEISWFRKGVNIELKNDNKYQMTNDGLMIRNAQPEDEGVYICQASVTSTGEVKRVDINVQVMSSPKWVIEPKDTEGVLGQDVIVKCEAFAKPAPVYTWTRNGIPVSGDRFLINGGQLTIRNAQREDTATYQCIAENNSGKIEAPLKIYVLIGPEIAIMNDNNVIEGKSSYLRCEVREAFPKAVIRWKYSDTNDFIDEIKYPNFKITSDFDENSNSNTDGQGNGVGDYGRAVGSWSQLNVERATRFDKRNFTCVASNKAAVSERQAQLLVEYIPKLILNQEARELYYSWIFTDEYGSSGNSASQAVRSYPVTFTCIADGEPKPLITWYFKGELIKVDNIKYKLLKDEPSLSKMEINPTSITDFGDYQCRAANRHGREERNIQLRQATAPKFAPIVIIKSINPESITFDIRPSDAPESDGGMPIEAYKLQWRFTNTEWSNTNEKEIPLDLTNIDVLTSPTRDVFNAEITSLLPDTEYIFRAASVNKPGIGVWSTKEIKVKTAPRRQPNPVKILSKEECQASTRCYIEWIVESNGGSPIREYLIRWRRIFYKDPLNQHLNTEKVEPWSITKIVKAPVTNFELTLLSPNSFYEVEVLARNDIGPSASQPFRLRTLMTSAGEAEAYEKKNAYKINRAIIIGGSVVGALFLFILIDLICLIKSNCGLLALITKSCAAKNKSNSSDYKTKTPPPKIAQHQPKPSSNGSTYSKTQYQPIGTDDTKETKVTIPINE